MAGERYVVLGLAMPRSPWFRVRRPVGDVGVAPGRVRQVRVGRGAAGPARVGPAASPRCSSTAPSAASTATCSTARGPRGCAVIVDGRRPAGTGRRRAPTPCSPPRFDRATCSTPCAATQRHDRSAPTPSVAGDAAPADARGVAGPRSRPCAAPGGTGASTVAIALAQGLAADVRNGGLVVLADLARHAEQAMLHDARDVVPGVQELVEAHRAGRPTGDRGPQPHLRRREPRLPRCCSGCAGTAAGARCGPGPSRPPSTACARAFRVVVADSDADLEGEAEGGSVDVEERNVMARTRDRRGRRRRRRRRARPRRACTRSSGVVGDLVAAGVDGGRIVAVVNRAPRGHRARAELARAIAELTPGPPARAWPRRCSCPSATSTTHPARRRPAARRRSCAPLDRRRRRGRRRRASAPEPRRAPSPWPSCPARSATGRDDEADAG